MRKKAPIIETAVSGVAAPRWRTRLPGYCRALAEAAGFPGLEVSLLLCGDERIEELNTRYRGKKKPTDVLSFPRDDGRGDGLPVAGDIAISLPALRRNAEKFGVSHDEELKRLLVHGILHLAGMDHGRGKGRAMLALQEKLLERLRGLRIIEPPRTATRRRPGPPLKVTRRRPGPPLKVTRRRPGE
jgi:probable rRNA maturation factor